MSEDENGARLDDQVVWHMAIVGGEDEHSLFAGHPLGHVVRVVVAVDLAQLERAEAGWPVLFVRVLHELVQDAGRTRVLNERAFDYCLQNGVGRRDDAAPARHLGRRQPGAPPSGTS